MAEIGTLEVMGHDLTITADAHGMFRLTDDGGVVGTGDTLEKAKGNARVSLRKRRVKVEVPFVMPGDGRRGVATGRDLRTRRHVLVLFDDGTKDALNASDTVFKPDIPAAQITRHATLRAEIKERAREVRDIEDEWGLRLRHEVDQAIQAEAEREEGVGQ